MPCNFMKNVSIDHYHQSTILIYFIYYIIINNSDSNLKLLLNTPSCGHLSKFYFYLYPQDGDNLKDEGKRLIMLQLKD